MKTSHVLKISIALIFCCYSVVYAKNWKDDSKQKAPGKSQYTQDRQGDRNSGGREEHERSERRDGREKHERVERRGGHDNQKYADYHKHRGYREHPHDKARHYGHYTYHGHQYDYHGHWTSWEQWDRYAKSHPQIYKHGRYYRENAHLMFRFCDPVSGSCFFFSIGR